MELVFAGLHPLCAPFLDRLGRLPGPQRDALGTAFGLSTASAATVYEAKSRPASSATQRI